WAWIPPVRRRHSLRPWWTSPVWSFTSAWRASSCAARSCEPLASSATAAHPDAQVNDNHDVDEQRADARQTGVPRGFEQLERDEPGGCDDREVFGPAALEQQSNPLHREEDRIQCRPTDEQ